MYWYAAGPTLTGEVFHQGNLMLNCRIPMIRELVGRHSARMLGEKSGGEVLDSIFSHIYFRGDPGEHRDYLRGVQDALNGRRKVAMPEPWKKVFPILVESPLPEVRERALALAVQFGDERAFTLLRKIVPDRAQPFKERESALKTLLFQQKADLVPILHDLLGDESLRGPAIRGLAAFDHRETPKLLLAGYARWNADDRSDAIQTLSSRAGYALALLDAVAGSGDPATAEKPVPRGDVNSYTIRQLQTLNSKEVAAKLTKVIGEIRPASADKAKLMAKYKAELKPDVLKKANLSNGRALYAKACPDLTGSQRFNLDYVLENVLDPSAIVPREHQVTVVETKQGRTLNGIVKKESDAAITLQLQNEVVVIPIGDIASRTQTKQSMMPDGAFEQLRIEEVRDLVAYLASPVQVPLKK
jgi:putative heme-binding domain-containing protein